MKNKIIIYQPNQSIKIEGKVDIETVWSKLKQMAQHLSRDKSLISRHLINIYQNKKLVLKPTVAKNATVQNQEERIVKQQIEYYTQSNYFP